MDRNLLLFLIVGAVSALIMNYAITGGMSGSFSFLIGTMVAILFLYKVSTVWDQE